MKENKVIHLFHYRMDPCPFQQFNTCICNGTLDASSSSKPVNSDMLDKDVVVPHYGQIGLMDGGDWGIAVSFNNIERGSFCSWWTVHDLGEKGESGNG